MVLVYIAFCDVKTAVEGLIWACLFIILMLKVKVR